MNNQLLVCICIPNYNNEKTIAQTLDSLLNQTYQNMIIKIFDNASTDDSMKILREYEAKYPHIQVFQNETNIGGEANFTKCIENMEGEYSAIYHADDLYHSTMLEIQIKYLIQHEISAVFVRANLIDENSKLIGEQYFPDELKDKVYHQFDFEQLFSLILKYDNFLITPSVMAKTDIYKNQIQSWNGDKFKTSADLDVWLRFSEIKDIGLITDKLISYRMSTASFSFRTKFNRFVTRDMFLVIDYYLDKYHNFKFSKSDYKFLKFKDNILVTTNKILHNKLINLRDIVLLDFQIISKIFFSKQKLKIYIYAIIIKVFLLLNLKKTLLKFIRKVNNMTEELQF